MKITFDKSFEASLLSGTKTTTRRPYEHDYCQYGYDNYIVDIFIEENNTERFLSKAKITQVKEEYLCDSIDKNLYEEGINTIEEFIMWNSFYSNYDDNPKIWTISFELI